MSVAALKRLEVGCRYKVETREGRLRPFQGAFGLRAGELLSTEAV